MSGSIGVHGFLYESRNLDKSYALNSPTPTERGELAVIKEINALLKPITKTDPNLTTSPKPRS